jgi:Domain of unknown function (DUF4918)
MPSFGQKVLDFHQQLSIPDIALPTGFEWLYPYDHPETKAVMSAFYTKYYTGEHKRHMLFGINPGRFGAGVTGVPFTDPVRLEVDCQISNSFDKKQELSAQFVWHFIRAYGGIEAFAQDFYINSVSPLGFIKDGININYYDDRLLIKAVEPFVVWNITTQMEMGVFDTSAICLGEGANFKFLHKLNEKHGFFREIVPLPHPRWVMQYRRKRMDEFVQRYVDALHAVRMSK